MYLSKNKQNEVVNENSKNLNCEIDTLGTRQETRAIVGGADILNEGKGRTYVSAKNKMSLGTLEVGFSEKMGGGNHTRIERVTEGLISRVKGKGDVVLSGKDIWSAGAELEAKNKFMALAENDLVLGTATVDSDFEEFHQTKSGSLAKTTKTRLDKVQSRHHLGTQVSGKDVLLSAGHDVKAQGLQAIAENDLRVQGGHDVDIGATTNHFKEVHQQTKKTSGVLASGAGITFGSKSEKHHVESEGWTQSDGRSTLGSLHGNISVQAGNHAHVMGTDMITPNTNRIDVEAASVKVEAGKDIIHTNERHEYKQSGVSLAVSTPVTDMAQAAYSSAQRSQQVANPKLKALYAMKTAEEAAMAAQNVGKVAETLDALRAGNMQQNGTTSSPSMKISLGYGSQKQTQSSESQSIRHQKSTLSTGVLNVRAHGEKVVFEGVDANAKLMALSGKQGIDIKGVKDEEHQRTENKSSGGSVGFFVGTNGNSYGLGIEGSANVAKGKSNSASERWQNSHFTADKIITNSEEGDLTLDAANLKAKRWEADIQNLTITSRQDTEKYESKQTSAGTSGSMAYGSGVGVSVNGAYSKAKVDYAQVNEQAGISVGEDGMDANIHNHAQLNAAIIESSAEESKNRFKAKSISTTDIENRSEIKTESASLGAGTGGINPMQAISSTLSLLGNTNESARSTTKSAISGNIQIETETPENLTALSRDTKNANQRVEKQDLQKVQERQEMAKVIGDITNNAISIATYEEREKINKLSLEKFKAEEKYGKESTQAQEIGKQITAIQNDIDGTYGIGSKTGMAIHAVTAALQAAAQNDTAGSLVALASPYLNQKIHEMTAGDTAKDKATNLMAHALLSAVEFQVTGKDPLTGAVAGVTGEATAEIIARAYGKPVSELTANEKENISTLSQLAGGLAAALTAKANGSTAEQGGSFIAATSGAETAKRAVENNALAQGDIHSAYQRLLNGEDIEVVLHDLEHLSQKERDKLLADCDAACRQVVPSLLMAANDFSEEQAIAIGSILSKIPADQRSRVDMLVQSENSKTLEAIENSKSDVEKHIALAVKVMRFFQAENAVSGGKPSKPFKVSTAKDSESYYKDGSFSSINAQVALSKKLSALESAQKSAVKIKTLPDGRVRYYDKERFAKNPGPTRGNSLVTEYNPKTGGVKQWMESYDHNGNVNRVHPKSVNGQVVDSIHYPPTGAELEKMKK